MDGLNIVGASAVALHRFAGLGRRGDPAKALIAGMRQPDVVTLAELAGRLARRHGDPADILLAAARPFDDACEPLRPLWAQEAMHRAVSMLRLFAALRRQRAWRPPGSIYERRLALHLAGELASLDRTGRSECLPCAGPLREIARDLVGLFGPAVGQVVLDTDVAALSLLAYQRRALVLLGSGLVTSALRHAFIGRDAGRVSLRLERVGSDKAMLQVSDDGTGFIAGRPSSAANIAGALTDLLRGEIRYSDRPGRGSMAEIVFPIDG